MNEINLHLKIKEYIMRISSKKDIINDLNSELEGLNKIKKELIQNKKNLKNEYNTLEYQNKNFFSNESNNLNYNINNQLNKKAGINKNNNYKKRNYSATKVKKRMDIDIITDLKKENNNLENILMNYKNELSNIIQQVNDMEIKCKLLTLNANEQTNLFKMQKKQKEK